MEVNSSSSKALCPAVVNKGRPHDGNRHFPRRLRTLQASVRRTAMQTQRTAASSGQLLWQRAGRAPYEILLRVQRVLGHQMRRVPGKAGRRHLAAKVLDSLLNISLETGGTGRGACQQACKSPPVGEAISQTRGKVATFSPCSRPVRQKTKPSNGPPSGAPRESMAVLEERSGSAAPARRPSSRRPLKEERAGRKLETLCRHLIRGTRMAPGSAGGRGKNL